MFFTICIFRWWSCPFIVDWRRSCWNATGSYFRCLFYLHQRFSRLYPFHSFSLFLCFLGLKIELCYIFKCLHIQAYILTRALYSHKSSHIYINIWSYTYSYAKISTYVDLLYCRYDNGNYWTEYSCVKLEMYIYIYAQSLARQRLSKHVGMRNGGPCVSVNKCYKSLLGSSHGASELAG